ncbi:MAG: lysophospholipid acyltransferase family protein, partial [Solimonas sp.]
LPVLNFIFRTARAIPIAPAKEDEAMMHRAFDEIARALEAGDIIGIFPEGQLTRDGAVGEFRSGIEKIVARTPAPVVPLALRGLWGSFFSRNNFLARMRLPSRFWSRIELVADAPIPPQQVKADDLERRVKALRGELA